MELGIEQTADREAAKTGAVRNGRLSRHVLLLVHQGTGRHAFTHTTAGTGDLEDPSARCRRLGLDLVRPCTCIDGHCPTAVPPSLTDTSISTFERSRMNDTAIMVTIALNTM